MRIVFVGRDQRSWHAVVLYPLTFGIWRRVWLARVTKEVDGHDALGLRNGLTMTLLCLPYAALALALTVFALGGGGLTAWYNLGPIILSLAGPSWVTFQSSRRISSMIRSVPSDDKRIKYGPAFLLWIVTLVPLVGNWFFIPWTQRCLNRFWRLERAHPERGVEVDDRPTRESDATFLIELGKAMRASQSPSSRFEGSYLTRRKAAAKAWAARLADVRAQRIAVRAAGGSTPIWPFSAPRRPAVRALHVVCGRCKTAFDVARDPLVETPVLCPSCGLLEILPSLRDDALAPAERGQVLTVRVDCPQCSTRFHALRSLSGATRLKCPKCGRADELPPGPSAAGRSARNAA